MILEETPGICSLSNSDLQDGHKWNDEKGICNPLVEGVVEIGEENMSSLAATKKHGTYVVNCS